MNTKLRGLGLFASLFDYLSADKDHVNGASVRREATLGVKQYLLSNELFELGSHDFCEDFSSYMQQRKATIVAAI